MYGDHGNMDRSKIRSHMRPTLGYHGSRYEGNTAESNLFVFNVFAFPDLYNHGLSSEFPTSMRSI